jgi:tRNA(adenine34) deaminase
MIQNFQDHQWFMGLALEQAELAYKLGEVPVGAVIVSSKGDVLSKSHNLKESTHNPTGHAEILSIIEATKELENWRLQDCTLYVTLEPCPMCLATMIQARIGKCVFGTYDSKGGALSLGYSMYKDSRLNHRFDIVGGLRHYDCSRLLSQFFKERRSAYSPRN